ncbi:helix-turn-helix domain-containing protein [Corynebacterium sp. HMSC14H10]|uniref:helix-turn-helix domain-containing protein n=1 Tax=Corynebacterium sp. HMSC14H10 TaxID=1581103 RepID=UPI0009F571D7
MTAPATAGAPLPCFSSDFVSFLKVGFRKMASLLTPGEVARRLGVSRQTLMRWRDRGVGPQYMQVGELVRYVPESVDAYASGKVREQ